MVCERTGWHCGTMKEPEVILQDVYESIFDGNVEDGLMMPSSRHIRSKDVVRGPRGIASLFSYTLVTRGEDQSAGHLELFRKANEFCWQGCSSSWSLP